jgi:hypothetical protein
MAAYEMLQAKTKAREKTKAKNKGKSKNKCGGSSLRSE